MLRNLLESSDCNHHATWERSTRSVSFLSTARTAERPSPRSLPALCYDDLLGRGLVSCHNIYQLFPQSRISMKSPPGKTEDVASECNSISPRQLTPAMDKMNPARVRFSRFASCYKSGGPRLIRRSHACTRLASEGHSRPHSGDRTRQPFFQHARRFAANCGRARRRTSRAPANRCALRCSTR